MVRTGPSSPLITEVVGDIDRPLRHFPFNPHLGHLPGRSGVLAGARFLLGMVREGEAFFTRERKRFGTVFRHVVGFDPIVCVADADLNLQIAQNRERIWSSALTWAYLLGGVNRRSATVDGPLATDGQYHQDIRQVLRPAFSNAALASYVELAGDAFRRRFSEWRARRRVALKAEVRRLLAEVSARVFLGVQDEAEGALLDRATAAAWLAPQAFLKRSSLGLAWRRARAGYDTLWDTLRPRVEERRARAGEDLFSRMCRSPTEGTWLDDDALVRVLISTMMAAFDTTSGGIASMAYLLCRHPEWQDRLRDEVMALGAASLTTESVKGLELHDRVWKESLRMMPVAGQLNRQALADVELGGHAIAAGTLVVALTGTTMRDGRYWTRPECFDPDRFSPERAEHKQNLGAYLPFGGGNHVCVGGQIATMEAVLFFATLLPAVRLRLAPAYEAGHTYLPFGVVSGAMHVELEPR